ncbi:MAG: erythromycin biosynthesis sensory transduction protein eryC1, partial [Proteobacteria bacterium]
RVPDRVKFMDHLFQRGVDSAIHYPVPVHQQDAYADLGIGAGSFPVSEACASEFVSLPMFPELTAEQLSHVIQVVREAIVKELAA